MIFQTTRLESKSLKRFARQGVRGIRTPLATAFGGSPFGLGRYSSFPVAKGSLTDTHSPCTREGCRLCAEGKGHRKLIFTFRENGKLRGLYVRPEHKATPTENPDVDISEARFGDLDLAIPALPRGQDPPEANARTQSGAKRRRTSPRARRSRQSNESTFAGPTCLATPWFTSHGSGGSKSE